MNIIDKMLDAYDASLDWLNGTWHRAVLEHHDGRQGACIMGALGVVLQQYWVSVHDVAANLDTHPDAAREVWTLFQTVVEQYPDWARGNHQAGVVECDEDTCADEWDYTQHVGFNNHVVVELLTMWNDNTISDPHNGSRFNNGGRSFESDIQPMLEKTAVRLAEQL